MADNLPTPESREEAFLAKAAGEDVELPKPVSRKEEYLNAIAQGGGGTFDITELFVLGIQTEEETGETHVYFKITDKQFLDALNAITKGLFLIVHEKSEEGSVYNYLASYSGSLNTEEEKSWSTCIPVENGCWYMYAFFSEDEQSYMVEFDFIEYQLTSEG